MNVAIYLRVSSEQQAERHLSIPAQREALQRYATDNGSNIVEEYIEEAKSAKSDEREDFQRMIADAKKAMPPFQAILVHTFDRSVAAALTTSSTKPCSRSRVFLCFLPRSQLSQILHTACYWKECWRS
jgi:hypothetical protein